MRYSWIICCRTIGARGSQHRKQGPVRTETQRTTKPTKSQPPERGWLIDRVD